MPSWNLNTDKSSLHTCKFQWNAYFFFVFVFVFLFFHFYCLAVTWGWWVKKSYRDNHQPPSSFSAIQSRYTCIMTVNNILFRNPPPLRAVIGLSKCSRCQDPSKNVLFVFKWPSKRNSLTTYLGMVICTWDEYIHLRFAPTYLARVYSKLTLGHFLQTFTSFRKCHFRRPCRHEND